MLPVIVWKASMVKLGHTSPKKFRETGLGDAKWIPSIADSFWSHCHRFMVILSHTS